MTEYLKTESGEDRLEYEVDHVLGTVQFSLSVSLILRADQFDVF
jgi:hypothetical protein